MLFVERHRVPRYPSDGRLPQDSRKRSTASTRRWSSGVLRRSSFAKIAVTCFSTARSVTTSRSAIARRSSGPRPSARAPRARASVSSSSGSSVGAAEQLGDDLGVERRAAVRDAPDRVEEAPRRRRRGPSAGSRGRRRCRRAARARSASSTYCDSTSTPTSGSSARIWRAARRPSSVWSAASGRRRSRRPACGRAPCAAGPRRRRPGRRPRSRPPRAAGRCPRAAAPSPRRHDYIAQTGPRRDPRVTAVPSP